MAAIWGLGALSFPEQYPTAKDVWHTADVWTRYSLGIPSALIASFGLMAQQRAFRKVGLVQFGRDSLTAAVALGLYGTVGQFFVRASRLPPSTYINEGLFFHWFQFPVQILRAGLAIVVAISVIRLMRSFDTEIQCEIDSLSAGGQTAGST